MVSELGDGIIVGAPCLETVCKNVVGNFHCGKEYVFYLEDESFHSYSPRNPLKNVH